MSQIASFRAKLAPIVQHLDDLNVTELQVNKPGELWLRTGDAFHAQRVEVPELTFSLLQSLAEVTASFKSLSVDRDSPILSAAIPVNLEDGVPDFERGSYRTEMILPPVVPEGTVAITIRKQSLVKMSLAKYEAQGAFRFVNQPVEEEAYSDRALQELYRAGRWQEFLRGAVLAHKTMAMSAGTYCGKTTCLNAILEEVPLHERIVVIEDSPEVQPLQPNCVLLSYARSQAGSQIGSQPGNQTVVTPTSLLRSCMRLTPDRIILGELRGPEAVEFLNMLNTGHKGSITTIHADSPAEMFDRFGELMDGHTSLTREQIIARVKRRVDIVVQWKFTERHGRYISEILYADA